MELCLLLLLAGLWASAGRGPQAQAGAPRTAQAQTVAYRYDGAGRWVRADYGNHIIVYTYNAAGNLLRRDVLEQERLHLPILLKGA